MRRKQLSQWGFPALLFFVSWVSLILVTALTSSINTEVTLILVLIIIPAIEFIVGFMARKLSDKLSVSAIWRQTKP